jgi:hypothetical protein
VGRVDGHRLLWTISAGHHSLDHFDWQTWALSHKFDFLGHVLGFVRYEPYLLNRAFPCLTTFIPVLGRTPSFGAPLSTPINHCATSQRAIFSQGVAFNRYNHSSQHIREARQLSFHLSTPGQLGSKYSQQRGQLSFSSIDLPTSDMVPSQIKSNLPHASSLMNSGSSSLIAFSN